MEKILEEDGFNARAPTWEQLGYEANGRIRLYDTTSHGRYGLS